MGNTPRPAYSRYRKPTTTASKFLRAPAYVPDVAVDALNKAHVLPAHVALPLRDTWSRAANLPVRAVDAVQKKIRYDMPFKEAYEDADIYPSRIAQALTMLPKQMDDRNFTDDELAELYLRSKYSNPKSGANGSITAYGNRKRNEELNGTANYAKQIPSTGFLSPQAVAEWAVGQASSINDEGHQYLYDKYAFDVDDTKGTYNNPKEWLDAPMKGVRRAFGAIGSKGYPGNKKTSYTSIPIQIGVNRMKTAYHKSKDNVASKANTAKYKAVGKVTNAAKNVVSPVLNLARDVKRRMSSSATVNINSAETALANTKAKTRVSRNTNYVFY